MVAALLTHDQYSSSRVIQGIWFQVSLVEVNLDYRVRIFYNNTYSPHQSKREELEMKRALKHGISLLFVLIFMVGLALPAFADGTVTPRTGTAYMYLGGPAGDNSFGWISLASGNRKFSVDREKIKVSGAGAVLGGVRLTHSGSEEEMLENGQWKPSDYNNHYYNYIIQLRMKKTGTTTISYSIGAKTYKLKVKILPYENPVKVISLSGVKNGKNFASLTKAHGAGYGIILPLNADKKNAVLKVTPAAGWKIRSAAIVDYKTGNQLSVSNPRGLMNTANLNYGTLRANRNYDIIVNFCNPTTGVERGYTYHVHGVNAS